jgi:hypothetical protein
MRITCPLRPLFFAVGCAVAFAQPDGGGSADGIGSDARFRLPTGVAVDDSGNIFVADSGNHTIRKVTAGAIGITRQSVPFAEKKRPPHPLATMWAGSSLAGKLQLTLSAFTKISFWTKSQSPPKWTI